MSDIDPGSTLMRHSIDTASAARRFTGVEAPVTSALPDGNETLAWLAGNRMPDRRRGLAPPSGVSESRADKVLMEPRPNDPIEAAQKRASILADLHREAPRDPRVQSVFEADPIVAEDPSNGNLVTQAMLTARLDLFDAVRTMLGMTPLSRGARTRAAVTLKIAYTMLDDDAQVEWALSEVRLEETKAFLDQREQAELNKLGEQLAAILNKDDLWAAARAFSMAAHIGVGQARGSAALSDLLEIREFDD